MFIFYIVSFIVLIVCIKNRAWIISVPMTVSLLYILWLGPQLIALRSISSSMEVKSNSYVAMSILCLLALLTGWILSNPGTRRYKINEKDRRPWSEIYLSLTLLTIVSALLAIALESVRVEVENMTQWSGRATIVNFFAQTRIIPLALSMLLFLRTKNRISTLLLISNLIIVLPIALVYMRRSELIDIITILFGGYWFVRNRLPNLIFILPAAVFTFLMIFIVADLRTNAAAFSSAGDQSSSILSSAVWTGIDIQAALLARVSQAPDVFNGINIIDYVSASQSYELGSILWNRLVHQWVPAQIVGADLKASLMFGTLTSVYDEISSTGAFQYQTGTTPTGIGSVFQDFGYLGVIYYGIVAFIMGRLFRKSKSGDIWDQSLYLVLLPISMISVTHGYPTFVVSSPIFIAFWWFFRHIAQRRIHFEIRKNSSQRNLLNNEVK